MNPNPLVSVIIPVYNVEGYLARCIHSVIKQNYRNIEILLIDDGSTDQSGFICDSWKEKDRRISVFHQSNKGLSGARNTGLCNIAGELITFIDSDDYITDDYISYLVSLLGMDSRCSMAACNHYVVRNGKKHPDTPAGEEIYKYSSKEAMEEALFHRNINVSSWAKIYRKEVFQDLRFPEGRVYEDTWIFGDILKRTEVVVFGCRCCYMYDIRKHSIVNSVFSPTKLQYIDSAQKMAEDALLFGDDLRIAGVRRVNHARLSTLRYMKRCNKKYNQLRKNLREKILEEAPIYMNDPRTPKRDKFGIIFLRISLGAFYFGWDLYSIFR